MWVAIIGCGRKRLKTAVLVDRYKRKLHTRSCPNTEEAEINDYRPLMTF